MSLERAMLIEDGQIDPGRSNWLDWRFQQLDCTLSKQ